MVLQDFLTVEIGRNSIQSLCNYAVSASYNGILLTVPDEGIMGCVDLRTVRIGIPIAMDVSKDIELIEKIIGIESLDYIVIGKYENIKLIPQKTKIILKYNLTDLDSLDELYMVMPQAARVDLWDISINLQEFDKCEPIVEFLSFVRDYSVNISIDGIPFDHSDLELYTTSLKLKGNIDLRSFTNRPELCGKRDTVASKCNGLIIDHFAKAARRGKHVLAAELPQVETVALYSGGLDSRLSVIEYVRNTDSSILLINFSDSNTLGRDRVRRSFFEELQKQEKIKGLLCISLQQNMYNSIINDERVSQLSSQSDTNLTCLMCKALFLYYASIIAKLVGASSIIMGNNQVHGINKSAAPLPQIPPMMDIYKAIPEHFGLAVIYPIYSLDRREDVVALAKEYGLDPSSSWYSSTCVYGKPKPLRYGYIFGAKYLNNFIAYLLKSKSLHQMFIEEGLKYAKYYERIRAEE